MKALTLIVISFPAIVAAQPAAARGPDFMDAPAAPVGDRFLMASPLRGPIEPSALVTFAFDSTALDPAAIAELDGIARWMRHHPAERLVLEGHTDRIGTIGYNLDLGFRRAEAVRDHLRSWGISGDRMIVAVFGEADAHRRIDAGDRRVVLFASQLPVGELSALMLDHTRADSVVWTDHGTQLEETRMVTASR